MPAKPQPLRTTEPVKRPPGIPDGLWSFPRNLAEEANARGWSQKFVAEQAGVTQPTVSRWLRYEIDGLKVGDVLKLEHALGLAHGTLTLPTTALRQRRSDVDVETHESLSPEQVRSVLILADKLRGKPLRQPRRGARAKRDHA